jgi:hypothetical protein
MSWIQFKGEVNEVNLARAEVGDRISLYAGGSVELRLRKSELRKSAKALKMKLKWEKDEERIEMGTRPGTEGLWRNSRGHYAYARIMAREVPLSPHGWGRQNDYDIDHGSTDVGAGTGVDLAVPGEPSDGFRSPSSNSGFGAEMGIRESRLHDRAKEDIAACIPGNASWYCNADRRGKEERRARREMSRRLGRRLRPDESATYNEKLEDFVLTSRGW